MAEEKDHKAAENGLSRDSVGRDRPASDVPRGAGHAPPAAKRARASGTRNVPSGVAHIKATFNNTMVTITDMNGGVIAWSSAGRAGFKGSRKNTAFAATIVGQDAARQAVGRGMREVEVHVQGPGSGRESAIRALQSAGLNVMVIKDVTPMPHNGCRQRTTILIFPTFVTFVHRTTAA